MWLEEGFCILLGQNAEESGDPCAGLLRAAGVAAACEFGLSQGYWVPHLTFLVLVFLFFGVSGTVLRQRLYSALHTG